MEIVIRIRTIDAMALASVLVHALLLAIPMRKPPPPPSGSTGPMQVVIVSPPQVQPPPAVEPLPEPVARPMPRPQVVPRREPTPRETVRVPQTAPEVPTPSPVPAPPVDMLAMIEARRAQRRAAEGARGPPSAQNSEPSKEDAATASLNRNLASLSGGEGVGGVFQILHIGPRSGEFAFNGWRPGAQRQWREVIEVDAGLGGNVELAMVRRMIELIRTHYSGDFNWESFRLHRVVVLSARKEDQEGLEDFLMREFFGPQSPHPAG